MIFLRSRRLVGLAEENFLDCFAGIFETGRVSLVLETGLVKRREFVLEGDAEFLLLDRAASELEETADPAGSLPVFTLRVGFRSVVLVRVLLRAVIFEGFCGAEGGDGVRGFETRTGDTGFVRTAEAFLLPAGFFEADTPGTFRLLRLAPDDGLCVRIDLTDEGRLALEGLENEGVLETAGFLRMLPRLGAVYLLLLFTEDDLPDPEDDRDEDRCNLDAREGERDFEVLRLLVRPPATAAALSIIIESVYISFFVFMATPFPVFIPVACVKSSLICFNCISLYIKISTQNREKLKIYLK
ncbi:MAG: hypothetical protein R6V06_03240 [Kiritimatiellia bacterium]